MSAAFMRTVFVRSGMRPLPLLALFALLASVVVLPSASSSHGPPCKNPFHVVPETCDVAMDAYWTLGCVTYWPYNYDACYESSTACRTAARVYHACPFLAYCVDKVTHYHKTCLSWF